MDRAVYVGVLGPNLETRAEYRMLRNWVDIVGMSTVPEAIAASLRLENPCLGGGLDRCQADALEPVNIKSIIAAASQEPQWSALFGRSCASNNLISYHIITQIRIFHESIDRYRLEGRE